jgi:hypothetical protein
MTQMKKKFKKINMRFLLVAVLVTSTLFSCSKWDEYEKYNAGGEIVYAGKLDSLKVLSGKYRLRLTGRLNADPKISMVKVFWNNNADSLVYEIKRGVSGNVFEQTIPMPESVTTFTVYTYHADGTKSVPTLVVGKSFGEVYRRSLTNRFVSSLATNGAKDTTTITWDAALTSVLHTEVRYPANPNGDTATVISTGKVEKTVLGGFNYQANKFRYRTIYRPDSTSIDTFATHYMIR